VPSLPETGPKAGLPAEAAAVDVAAVFVVGAGTMGSGIAQVVAQAGFRTLLYDAERAVLDRAMGNILPAWQRSVAKGRLTAEEAAAATNRLSLAPDLNAGAEVDLVIEAIVESEPAKVALFERLGALARPTAILASNTSSISITRLGAAAGDAGRVVGLHFFNPVPVLPLVEVVRGLATSEATCERAVDFARRIGKTPITVNDSPGFVANRVLMPMINEAIFALTEGVADAVAIDEVMKLGMAHPMGPLALADLIGLDVCLGIMETLHHDLGEAKYRPAPLLRRLVAAGRLGRKTGHGFHRYDTGRR